MYEILRECNITKGSLYHHFPNGKEELLITCLQSMHKTITTDIEDTFNRFPTALEAAQPMLEKLITDFEREGTIVGHTFSSMVSEMASVSEPVRNACLELYVKIQRIIADKLTADGFSEENAHIIALSVTEAIEGAMLLCLTQKSSGPLKMISQVLPNLVKEVE
ncbi:TetR/AcrR family transcriptional regulator [Bacillus benzoevorans]|uniref:TetR/AcrR family transcriptional repressor of lmrAB and yxaGH operons n=1 Tax=Bacillus benzoevorans TaxID=1456 RepID=A0A7X0HUG9_9BACI|nr:TetR/AcrR family transcriptional regulator [Bacillus benzoevorans]MBB6447084.1 TetR/AcrR family transcriptional repressor of lmrAB and yxaGH operons [Bacillus benzoevorans]